MNSLERAREIIGTLNRYEHEKKMVADTRARLIEITIEHSGTIESHDSINDKIADKVEWARAVLEGAMLKEQEIDAVKR